MFGRPGPRKPAYRHAKRPDLVRTDLMPPDAATAGDGMPRAVAQYELRAKLGEGGMGVVYRARDTALDRPVALKLLRPESFNSPEARARFLREARAVAAVKSDHVVTTYQAGEENGVLFLAMELLDGSTLDDRLVEGRPLPPAEVARIGREAALGLAAAHTRGLVHRDVKPANLWVEAPGGRVKVLDFGLARPCVGAARITATGVILGTPAYMSPEQAHNDALDARSDVFSLGAVLYRLVTGRLPFLGDSAFAVLASVALDTPPPVGKVVPHAPPALATLIDRMLAKAPGSRPQSAAEVADLLAAIGAQAAGPDSPRPAGATPLPVKLVPPRPPGAGGPLPALLRSMVLRPPTAEREESLRTWPVAVVLALATLVAVGIAVHIQDPSGESLKSLVPRPVKSAVKGTPAKVRPAD